MPDDLRTVFEHLRTMVAYAKAAILFEEADPAHSVFIVCSGRVKVMTSSREGKVLLLQFAGPGEILGLAEAMRGGGAPYEYTAMASEPSVLAVVPRETFSRFVRSYGEVCRRVTIVLSEQYRRMQAETRFLAFGESSTARLARILLDWSQERGEEAPDGVHIHQHVTHTELAQSIGTTRETVTRILGDLYQRGIVAHTAGELVIRSAPALSRLAC